MRTRSVLVLLVAGLVCAQAYDVKFDELLDVDTAETFGAGFTAAIELQRKIQQINRTAQEINYGDVDRVADLEMDIGEAIANIAGAKRRTSLLVLHSRIDNLARGLFETIAYIEVASGKTIYESGSILTKRAQKCGCEEIVRDTLSECRQQLRKKTKWLQQIKFHNDIE